MAYLWVALGGALGSVARYAFSGAIARMAGGAFPFGTMVVNVSGAILIGFLAALTPGGDQIGFLQDRRQGCAQGREAVLVGRHRAPEADDLVAVRLISGGPGCRLAVGGLKPVRCLS